RVEEHLADQGPPELALKREAGGYLRDQGLALADVVAGGKVGDAGQQRRAEGPARLEGAPPPGRGQGGPRLRLEGGLGKNEKVVGQGTILVPTLCVGTPLATLRVAAAPLMKRDAGGAAATQSVAEGGSHAERGNQGQRRANEGYFPAAASSAGWEEASKTR